MIQMYVDGSRGVRYMMHRVVRIHVSMARILPCTVNADERHSAVLNGTGITLTRPRFIWLNVSVAAIRHSYVHANLEHAHTHSLGVKYLHRYSETDKYECTNFEMAFCIYACHSKSAKHKIHKSHTLSKIQNVKFIAVHSFDRGPFAVSDSRVQFCCLHDHTHTNKSARDRALFLAALLLSCSSPSHSQRTASDTVQQVYDCFFLRVFFRCCSMVRICHAFDFAIEVLTQI